MANEGIYTRIVYKSNALYNEGLKKAQVRDLSGAIVSLRGALSLNKKNTNARNFAILFIFYIIEDCHLVGICN